MFFDAFLNDVEQFFAKIDAFRTIFCKNDAILSGFEQVGDTDCREYIDWVKWLKDRRSPELRAGHRGRRE